MESGAAIKKETIVEAALRRFSHFGINKTTLAEIAGDLGISKPSLFYYFADKDSLVIAVMEKLFAEFLESFRTKLAAASSAEEGILFFVETKGAFFKQNLQLAMQADDVHLNRSSPRVLKAVLNTNRVALQILANTLCQGVDRGELQLMDTTAVARLLLQTLHAVEIAFARKSPIPTENDIDQLISRQKQLVTLIFNGLIKQAA